MTPAKDSFVVNPGQPRHRPSGRRIDHVHRAGARKTDAHDEVAVGRLVHAENRKGIGVGTCGYGVSDPGAESISHHSVSVSSSRRLSPARGMRSQSGRFADS